MPSFESATHVCPPERSVTGRPSSSVISACPIGKPVVSSISAHSVSVATPVNCSAITPTLTPPWAVPRASPPSLLGVGVSLGFRWGWGRCLGIWPALRYHLPRFLPHPLRNTPWSPHPFLVIWESGLLGELLAVPSPGSPPKVSPTPWLLTVLLVFPKC